MLIVRAALTNNTLYRSNDEDSRSYASKAEKLSMKKKGIGSEARAEHMAKADTDLQLLSHNEQERQLQKQKKRRLHGREEDVCTLSLVILCSCTHIFIGSKINVSLCFLDKSISLRMT